MYGTYTQNPTDLYIWRSTLQNKAFSNQNKGHLGSRYLHLVNLLGSSWVKLQAIRLLTKNVFRKRIHPRTVHWR